MESISSLITYQTDTFNSWGLGHTTLPSSQSFEEVLKYAVNIKAPCIVKPSRGKFWYIKGINRKKTYEEIKEHLDNNLTSLYKPNSKTWLIKYDNNN